MCKKLLLVLLPLLFTAASLAGAEQQYLITESQLQSIERSLERYEMDRQSWQLQAAGLKSEAQTLNAQLQEEREKYKTLETSFNRYEASQSETIAKMGAEIEKLRARNKNKASGLIVLAIVLAGAIAMLLKKLFKR